MLTYAVINEELAMEAALDRVIVEQDEYRSGRECSKCDGKKHLGVKCKYCKGTGFFKGDFNLGHCPDCLVGTSDLRESLGYEPCDLCKGTGTSSIIIPDNAQTRPTTGKIVSIGPLANYYRSEGQWIELPEEAKWRIGDKVLFTTYTGNVFEIGKKSEMKIRYIKASEILGRLKGIVKKSIEAGEFSELEASGISTK